MGAGAFIFNEKGELLVVKPTYKNYWSIPGGVVDVDESPRHACIREVKEEIGIDITDVGFVAVDYLEDAEGKGENLQFTFYGGVLKNEQKVTIDNKEIGEYKFVSMDEAEKILGKNVAKRFSKCLNAIKDHKGIYLENGA